ncbi:uncharacterized protein LOC110843435 [Folsomia candida]|nr:uncharacterized protein LOC110843435 [Folsomia candida]
MDKLLAEFEKLDDQVIVDWMANDFSLEAFDEVRESTLPEELLLEQQFDNKNYAVITENSKIRVTKSRFFQLPPSTSVTIPLGAFSTGIRCQVMGIDSEGFVFIGFPHHPHETRHLAVMARLNQIYNNLDYHHMRAESTEIVVGEILVGKIRRKISHDRTDLFLRVQVVQIDPERETITAVDIDEQVTYNFHRTDMYRMMKYFYQFPMRAIKCILAGLEEFIGTSVITDAIRSSECTDFNMIVKIVEDLDAVDEIPKIILYTSDLEIINSDWSFNRDICRSITNWNNTPLKFLYDMILTDVRITHATVSGNVWVQLQSGLMDVLQDLHPIRNVFMDSRHILTTVSALRKQGKEAFVMEFDGKYRRVTVHSDQPTAIRRQNLEEPDDDTADTEVFLTHTDFGTTQLGYLGQLIPFSYFPEILEDVPPQGFAATLGVAKGDVILKRKDIDLLRRTKGLKIGFSAEEKPSPAMGTPVITVYFPADNRRNNFRRPDVRPESRCSNASGGSSNSSSSSSSNSSSSSSSGSRGSSNDISACQDRLPYQRYLLPLEERYNKLDGRLFEYNYDHKSIQMYRRHISVLEYAPNTVSIYKNKH